MTRLIPGRIGRSYAAGRPEDAAIVERAARACGVTRAEVVGKSRLRCVVRARHAAMFVLRRDWRRSWNEIAQVFGCADHTTPLDAVQRFAARLETDAALVQLVAVVSEGGREDDAAAE